MDVPSGPTTILAVVSGTRFRQTAIRKADLSGQRAGTVAIRVIRTGHGWRPEKVAAAPHRRQRSGPGVLPAGERRPSTPEFSNILRQRNALPDDALRARGLNGRTCGAPGPIQPQWRSSARQ